MMIIELIFLEINEKNILVVTTGEVYFKYKYLRNER